MFKKAGKHKFPIGPSPRAIGQNGFTLVEVILAVFIFTIGIIGAVMLVQNSLSSINVTKSKLAASYLSQEGIEIARNIRDANWLAQSAWDSGLAAGDYEASYSSQSLSSYSNSYLNQDSSGFYSYSAGNSTIFKRKITISDKTASSFKVSSRVDWQVRGADYHVEALEYLYNWK